MKQQTDLTQKDLSKRAVEIFRSLSERVGRNNVTGGDWYVRLHVHEGTPMLLLIVPVTFSKDCGEWTEGVHEYQTVVA